MLLEKAEQQCFKKETLSKHTNKLIRRIIIRCNLSHDTRTQSF